MQAIDSAVLWPDGKVYFFVGGTFISYDVDKDRADGGEPRPVDEKWPGLQDASSIQGAVVWPNGKAYFFVRDRYFRFTVAGDKATLDPGSPFPTLPNWHGLQKGPNRNSEVQAAVLWPNGMAYLFQDDRYYEFNVKDDKVQPGFPKLLDDGWRGLTATGNRLVAAFVWPKLIEGRQKAYFLEASLYHRVDVANKAVDAGFPKEITGNWPGL